MKWCCSKFEELYELAGGRGFAIIVEKTYLGKAQAFIQFKAVGNSDAGVKCDEPISLISDLSITHCPWCGRDVQLWYSKYVDELYRPNLKIRLF